MLHHHLRRVSRTPKTLAYVDYVASGTDTITIPAAAAAGDLAILYDLARSIASAPTLVTPSGWTTLSALQQSPVSAVLSYKILAAGEPGSTITGMNGNIADVKTLVVLRATPALAGVTVTDINEQATTGNPNAQTIEALTSYPYVVYGVCGGRGALPAWASRGTPIRGGRPINALAIGFTTPPAPAARWTVTTRAPAPFFILAPWW
jgi:hypothetical protein